VSELDMLQKELDILAARVAEISATVNALPSLYTEAEKPVNHHWINYIFPPKSNLLRYKCSACGYISTFKTLSCPRCKEMLS
jgi:rubrerythrin